jgi:DNA transformation protein
MHHFPAEAPIEELQNLGARSGQWLREVGVSTVGELRHLGAVTAYRLVKEQQPGVSLNLLWAMAAGLEQRDWRDLTSIEKQQLKREAGDD